MLLSIITISASIGIFISFFEKREILSRLISLVPMVTLFISLGYNIMNRDYVSYEWMYKDLVAAERIEPGYIWLQNQLLKFGNPHTIIVFLTAILLFITLFLLNNSTYNLNVIFLAYSTYPLFYDITQLRNTIMYLIVYLGLYFLMKGYKKLFILFVILGSTFHLMAIIYLLFVFFENIPKKKFEKYMIIGTLIAIICSPILVKVFTVVFPSHAVYALKTPGKGIFINIIYIISDVLTVYIIRKLSDENVPAELDHKLDVMYRFSWLAIIALPFSFYFLDIIRIERNTQLVKVIFAAISMKFMSTNKRLIVLVLIIFTSLFTIIMLNITNQTDMINYVDFNSFTEKIGSIF